MVVRWIIRRPVQNRQDRSTTEAASPPRPARLGLRLPLAARDDGLGKTALRSDCELLLHATRPGTSPPAVQLGSGSACRLLNAATGWPSEARFASACSRAWQGAWPCLQHPAPVGGGQERRLPSVHPAHPRTASRRAPLPLAPERRRIGRAQLGLPCPSIPRRGEEGKGRRAASGRINASSAHGQARRAAFFGLPLASGFVSDLTCHQAAR